MTDVGSIISRYYMDLSELKKSEREAQAINRQLERDAKQTEQALLAQQRRMDQAAISGERLATQVIAKVDREFQQLQDQMIRNAVAAGNYAQAQQKVAAALAMTDDASLRYQQLLTQQIAITRMAERETEQLAAAEVAAARKAEQAANTRKLSLADVAKAYAGYATLKKGFELAEEGAQVKGVAESFKILAEASGIAADALLGRMRAAARGTIDDLTLMKQANMALVAENKELVGALPELLELARTRAVALGRDTSEAYSRLIEGLAKAEPEILDELGIRIKLNDAYEQAAMKMGKSAQALTIEEKSAAMLESVLEQTRDATAKLGAASDGTSERMARLKTSATNLGNDLKGAVADGVVGVSDKFGQLYDVLTGGEVRSDATTRSIAQLSAKLVDASNQAITGSKSYEDYLQKLDDVAKQYGTTTDELGKLTPQQYAYIESLQLTGETTDYVASRIAFFLGQTDGYIAVLYNIVDAIRAIKREIGGAVAAAEERSGFDDLNNARGQAGQDRATERERQKRVAQQNKDLADLNNARRGAGGDRARQQETDRQELRDIDEANRERIRQIGTQEQQLALLNAELAKLPPGSAAYIKKQTEILELKQAIDRANDKASDKSARAAAKLEKQEEASARRIVEMQRDAARDIEKIHEDHYRKLQELQADYDVKRTRDREDFDKRYRRLLAEGKRQEAADLKAEFELEQKRAAEDLAREKSKTRDDESRDVRGRQEGLAEQLAKEAAKGQKVSAADIARAQQALDAALVQGQSQASAGGSTGGRRGAGVGGSGGGIDGGETRIRLELKLVPAVVGGELLWTVVEDVAKREILGDLADAMDITASAAPALGGQGEFRRAM